MLVVEKELEKREANNDPVRVGMIGAGFMGQGIAFQLQKVAKGIELVAISNRHISKARKAFEESGAEPIEENNDQVLFDHAIRRKDSIITENPMLLCRSEQIDVIIEVTGAVEFGAHVVMEAIKNKKHVVLMNAELDGTIGPILKVYADRHNVVFTNSDGDQPGVIMNLYRFVKRMGLEPVLCGNIKGLQDRYRTPTTQEAYAKKWGQKPEMVTSFADGSKISYEQALVANATGMKVGKRGMYGPTVPKGTPLDEVVQTYPEELLHTKTGIVDYVVGASPAPGVFVIGKENHPLQQHFLKLYKMGDGPFYCFYTPYHLCHLLVPDTIARAALFNVATIAPAGKPYVDVIAMAKKDLSAGSTIDGIGKYMIYGECENSEITQTQRLLPLGLAKDCVLQKDVSKDQAITYDDVSIPKGRLVDKLRKEQNTYFNFVD